MITEEELEAIRERTKVASERHESEWTWADAVVFTGTARVDIPKLIGEIDRLKAGIAEVGIRPGWGPPPDLTLPTDPVLNFVKEVEAEVERMYSASMSPHRDPVPAKFEAIIITFARGLERLRERVAVLESDAEHQSYRESEGESE